MVIQPGEIYMIDGTPHEVLTVTTEVIGESNDELVITKLVYWLKNLETNTLVYLTENELQDKIQISH